MSTIRIYDNRKTLRREVFDGDDLICTRERDDVGHDWGHYPDHPDNAPEDAPKEPTLYVPQAVNEKVRLRCGLVAKCLSLAPLVMLLKRDFWWADVWQDDGSYEDDSFINRPEFDIVGPYAEPRKPRAGFLLVHGEGYVGQTKAIELTPEVSDALAEKGLLQ